MYPEVTQLNFLINIILILHRTCDLIVPREASYIYCRKWNFKSPELLEQLWWPNLEATPQQRGKSFLPEERFSRVISLDESQVLHTVRSKGASLMIKPKQTTNNRFWDVAVDSLLIQSFIYTTESSLFMGIIFMAKSISKIG